MIETDEEAEISDSYICEAQDDYIAAISSAKSFVNNDKTSSIKGFSQPASDPKGQLSSSDVLSLVNLPKVELEIYSGDPLKYQTFSPCLMSI